MDAFGEKLRLRRLLEHFSEIEDTREAWRVAHPVRAHWRVELHCIGGRDVTFRDDVARVRKGRGAKNTAVVRHFAVNVVRTANDKRNLELCRRLAAGYRNTCSSQHALSRIRSREWAPYAGRLHVGFCAGGA